MTRLEINWPDEMAEQVRAAQGRIERAGASLREIPLDERLQLIAQVLKDWTSPDSTWRPQLAAALAADSPLREETLREGLDAALAAWDPTQLVECARHELAGVMQSTSLALAPFAWTAVLAGGGVPMPTLLGALLPLIVGSPVLMRTPSHDQATGSLVKRSLEARSESLARAFESIAFAASDTAFDDLLAAPCVVATGSDETIQSIAARLRPNQRFVAYGHRFSIGVVGPISDRDPKPISKIAEGFATDIARWDQTGCLSPVVLYAVGESSDLAGDLAETLADRLDEISKRLPRGELSTSTLASHATERAEARMRQIDGRTRLFEGEEFTVVLEADAQPRPAPLFRFIRILPVPSIEALDRALRPFAGQVSNVACSGFTTNEYDDLLGRLRPLGVSRFTEPGRLQTPPIDWPHDGMPLLTPMARFVQSD